jgi:dTDP-4-dehydrorhamnose 3,5-epimerase
MSFIAEPLPELPDIWLITPTVYPDERGEFLETFQAERFRRLGIGVEFVQDNHSVSRRGVVRGLHYQLPPHAQAKLVSVAAGEIFDVVVDVRRSSPGFGKWAGRTLSSETHQMLWIPEGFAHGFLALSDAAAVVYKAAATYDAASERSLSWDDPAVGIEWPEIAGGPTLSPKDLAASALADADTFL